MGESPVWAGVSTEKRLSFSRSCGRVFCKILKSKNVLFVLSLVAIVIGSKLVSPTPSSNLVVMGILFASSYLLFYSSDIAVFWYKLQAEKAIKNNQQAMVKEMYLNIHRISPGSLSGKTALAIVYSLQGEWKQAEKLYREVLRSRPFDTRIQYNLAIAQVKQGDYEEALRSLLLILTIYPGWAATYSAVGEIYLAQENYDLAYKYFKAALLLNAEDPSATFHLPLLNKKLEQVA